MEASVEGHSCFSVMVRAVFERVYRVHVFAPAIGRSFGQSAPYLWLSARAAPVRYQPKGRGVHTNSSNADSYIISTGPSGNDQHRPTASHILDHFYVKMVKITWRKRRRYQTKYRRPPKAWSVLRTPLGRLGRRSEMLRGLRTPREQCWVSVLNVHNTALSLRVTPLLEPD